MRRAGNSLTLLKGTLDLLVLKALSWGPRHGYGIATWLEERSGGELGVEDSALYQALHRLEARRQVEADWGVTRNKRRARFYRLTPEGEQHFRSEAQVWERYARSVSEIIALETPAG